MKIHFIFLTDLVYIDFRVFMTQFFTFHTLFSHAINFCTHFLNTLVIFPHTLYKHQKGVCAFVKKK